MIVNAGFQGIIVINYLNKVLFYLFFFTYVCTVI